MIDSLSISALCVNVNSRISVGMRLDQVLALLRRECEKAGGQAAWATAAGVSPAYVSDVLHGRRQPGDGILRHLALERVTMYRRAKA